MNTINGKDLENKGNLTFIKNSIEDIMTAPQNGIVQLIPGMVITKKAIGRSMNLRSEVEVFYVEFANQPNRDGWYEKGKWTSVLARRSEAYLMPKNIQAIS